jgi:Flp pilus assembly protein TadG
MPTASPDRLRPSTGPARRPAMPGTRGRDRRESGQSLVEFSLILAPLLFILLGIIQFGFIFNTYITMTNAARDAARMGTIYEYDRTLSKSANDLARNNSVKSYLLGSMNFLGKTSPQFSVGSSWVQSGTTYTNGDLVITYAIPAGISDTEPRVGQTVTVRAVYHQDLIVPLIASLLPKDAGGRMGLTGEVTMVIN